LGWKNVRELVVGRIRNTPECNEDDDEDDISVLSLGLFPGEYLELPGEDRILYRFEAAWDTSLHSSILLNRVTPSGEHVYVTLSAYLDLEKCSQPTIITKDISVVMCSRDARTPRSLKQLLTRGYKNAEANRLTGVYEAVLRRNAESGARRRRVVDTRSNYVRGEENLSGWNPRGDSLLWEHQWALERMLRLESVTRTTHQLLLREKLRVDDNPFCIQPKVTPKVESNLVIDPYQPWKMTDREKYLANKFIKLIQAHRERKPFFAQSDDDGLSVASSASCME
jgi:kinesin family protein 1